MFTDALKRAQKNLEEYATAISDPINAQKSLFNQFLMDYCKTSLGESYDLDSSTSLDEYRRKVQATGYKELSVYFESLKKGAYNEILTEEPITWVLTRGTTGQSKIIPVTEKHLSHLIKGGARAVLNTAFRRGGLENMIGGVLNLQFPSNTKVMNIGGNELVFGFSSGTYARLNPMMAGLVLIPRQEEIDSLETGLSISDWEKRYEFIFQRAREEDVVTVMGVAPVQTGFARYLKKKHSLYPKDVWDITVVYTTSVAKIHSKYKPVLRKMYGDVSIVEMYTATEGAFGQQMDDYPYWRPNYDLYIFEVKTSKGTKMLYELKRGEWGSLIISTPILQRYKIGDLVEAAGNNYFRTFGRDTLNTRLEHLAYRKVYGWMI
jgi:hypothetical protein